MNALEKIIVRSAPRGWFQRLYECPLLTKMAPLPRNARVLEMGCGNGLGVTLLYEKMGAGQVDAFDADPEMVQLTRERTEREGLLVPLWHGSAADIPAGGGTYDAVVSFGMLHHMADWSLGIKEAYRVLKGGGLFYMGEYYQKLICHPIMAKFIDHPQRNRFTHEGLKQALEKEGFEIVGEKNCSDLFGWIVVRKKRRSDNHEEELPMAVGQEEA